MSLSSAENILNIHGGNVESQLCSRNPLIILETILASSLQLKDVSLNELTVLYSTMMLQYTCYYTACKPFYSTVVYMLGCPVALDGRN